MKFLIMQFSPLSRHFITLRTKYNFTFTLSNVIRYSGDKEIDGTSIIHGETRNAYRILMGNSLRKKALERYRCRWENNFKIDLTDIGWRNVNWIPLVTGQGPVVGLYRFV
jgi:hypothetical protein